MDNLEEISMCVLIGQIRKGGKRYTKFRNHAEIMHFIASKYKEYKVFDGTHENKNELSEVANEWLLMHFGITIPERNVIFEPHKEGYYIVTHNSHGILQTCNTFFICNEDQLTNEEKSRLISKEKEG